MGYSQGGGASSWAASLAPSYAPDINLITDVSGGVPADVRNVAESLDGNVGAGLMLDALVGLQQAYPGRFPLDPTLNETGRAAVATVKTRCVVQTLVSFPVHQIQPVVPGRRDARAVRRSP
jgi:Secretory lipase